MDSRWRQRLQQGYTHGGIRVKTAGDRNAAFFFARSEGRKLLQRFRQLDRLTAPAMTPTPLLHQYADGSWLRVFRIGAIEHIEAFVPVRGKEEQEFASTQIHPYMRAYNDAGVSVGYIVALSGTWGAPYLFLPSGEYEDPSILHDEGLYKLTNIMQTLGSVTPGETAFNESESNELSGDWGTISIVCGERMAGGHTEPYSGHYTRESSSISPYAGVPGSSTSTYEEGQGVFGSLNRSANVDDDGWDEFFATEPDFTYYIEQERWRDTGDVSGMWEQHYSKNSTGVNTYSASSFHAKSNNEYGAYIAFTDYGESRSFARHREMYCADNLGVSEEIIDTDTSSYIESWRRSIYVDGASFALESGSGDEGASSTAATSKSGGYWSIDEGRWFLFRRTMKNNKWEYFYYGPAGSGLQTVVFTGTQGSHSIEIDQNPPAFQVYSRGSVGLAYLTRKESI